MKRIIFFLIFGLGLIFFVQTVNAQVCPVTDPSGAIVCTGTLRWCNGACREAVLSCPGDYVPNCDVTGCCSCPAGTTDCGGLSCQSADGTCAALNRSTTNVCAAPDSCGACLSGFADLTPATFNDACIGNRPAVTLAPFAVQTDDQGNPSIWINKTGAATNLLQIQQNGADRLRLESNGSLRINGSGGDVYLNSGKAIRIDGVDAVLGTSLNIGNYDDGGSADRDFHLRLHASDLSIPEILFQQGTEDYWSISLRTPSHNLEIWRNNIGGWDEMPVLAIEHSTGEIIINSGLTVNNGLVVAGNITLSTANATVDGKNLDNMVVRPSPCNANQIIQWSGTAWVCANISSGLATSEDATTSKIPKFIGTPLMLTDSMLTENGNTVNVEGNITATGCFGPVYRQMSADPGKDGDIDEDTGGANGYTAANALCNAALGGSHVCTTNEMLQSINCGVLTSAVSGGLLAIGNEMWISNGAPSLPTPTNDCFGWTDDQAASQGIKWQYQSNGGAFYAENCNIVHRFACCK